MTIIRSGCFTLLIVGIGPIGVVLGADPDLVKLTRDGHQAAVSRVQQLVCRFRHEVVAETRPGQAARLVHLTDGWYRRDGGVVRRSTQHPGTQYSDALIRDGRMLWANSWPASGSKQMHLATGVFDLLPDGNMWEELLFEFYDRFSPPRTRSYSRILSEARAVRAAGWQPEGGRSLARLDVDTVDLHMSFFLDPRKNFLVARVRWAPFGPGQETEREVIDWVEFPGGVHLPTTVEQRLIEKGQVVARTRTVLTDLRVNKPIAADELRLTGIAGRSCIDMDTKREYTVDADGKQTGPAKSVIVTPGVSLPADSVASPPRPPSRPGWPWWWYVLAAAGGAILLAGYVRYRQLRSD